MQARRKHGLGHKAGLAEHSPKGQSAGLFRRGLRQHAAGQHEIAVASFAAVAPSSPHFADSLYNLAATLGSLGRHTEAVDVWERLHRLRPHDAACFTRWGAALSAAGRLNEAVAVFSNGCHHHPDNVELLALNAAALLKTGRPELAIGALYLLAEHSPDDPATHRDLSLAFLQTGQLDDALRACLAALRLAEDDVNLTNLSAVLLQMGAFAEALDASEQALLRKPDALGALNNHGLALEGLGRFDDAVASGRHAVAITGEHPVARHNLAATLLSLGRLTSEAWDHYEARLLLKGPLLASHSQSLWQGQAIAGQTIVLHAEQGFGDTLQFLRYAELVAQRGARVVLVVQPALRRLLRSVKGVDRVLSVGDDLPPHEWIVPLLSLPRLFGTTLETIPARSPYLAAEPKLVEAWRLPPSRALRVGLAWAGGPLFVEDRQRSMRLADLAPLATIPGVELHSLQKHDPARAPEPLPAGMALVDRMAGVQDFADTAALIAGLDLVIAVDTAVAHLAAAMGKPVWLLSRFRGCWRWLHHRTDSPWYPTVRIYRQTTPRDWSAPVDALCTELRTLASQPRRPCAPAQATASAPSPLSGLDYAPSSSRNVVAILGENENGALRQVSQEFMDLLPPHGFTGHLIDMSEAGWALRLKSVLDRGVLFAWGAAGVGARLPLGDRLLWDALEIPFISVLADSPCWMPSNHNVASRYVANGYVFRDWFNVQRRLIRSPQVSALLPHGVVANAARDETAWSDRPHRMVFVKTGHAPERHREEWAAWPPRYRMVVEDAAAAALQRGIADITDTVLNCIDAHGLYLDQRPDILFGLMRAVDVYVRDQRSTNLARALLDLPAVVIGRGWGHVAELGGRATFHPPVDAGELPTLYGNTQFLLNTMPNIGSGTHERVAQGFSAKCCVVTDENQDMKARFGRLPSYHPVETNADDVQDRLESLFHSNIRYDDAMLPALDLVETEFSAGRFLRGLFELAAETRASAMFASFSI